MKSFLIFILLVLLVFIGWQYLITDNGYVLIEFLNYSIEASVPAFVGCLIVLYVVIRTFGVVWRSPKMIRNRMSMRSKERSVRLHHEALDYIGRGLSRKAMKKQKNKEFTNILSLHERRPHAFRLTCYYRQ